MGLIARRLSDFDEVRFDREAWLNDDDYDQGKTNVAGTSVTRRSALGLTTVWRCWDLLSSAVAMSPRDVIVKVGGQSFTEFSPPRWVNQPNPSDPTMTGSDYFSQVALSLLAEGNYFTFVYPHVFDPDCVLILLDPRRVDVKPGPRYDIKDAAGKVIQTVGPEQMLHGVWIRMPGELRGISPLEAMRTAYGTALATQEHAARFFGQGASLSFGVEVPGPMDKAKKEEMRESLRKKYAGITNSHAIGVLTHGAKFVTGLAPTPEQAQMLASREFEVEDVCRPHGVPAAMAGSTQPGAASYAAVEAYREEFRASGVGPMAVRIESQHDRLLTLPLTVTDPSATIHFRFNLDWVARTNLLSRYQAHAAGVQGGFLIPDEARALEDLPPLPGGDKLYMQQQMVPIDKPSLPDPKVADLGALVRAGYDPEAAAAFLGLPNIKHTGLVPVTVQGENVATDATPVRSDPEGNLPDTVVRIPAPTVNVPAAMVQVAAPIVDTTPFTNGLAELRQLLMAPVRKVPVRDAQMRITEVIETRIIEVTEK